MEHNNKELSGKWILVIQTSIKLEISIHWNIFFSLKSPAFLPNISKLKTNMFVKYVSCEKTWPDNLYNYNWSYRPFAFLKLLWGVSDWTFKISLRARKVTPMAYHRSHLTDLDEFLPFQGPQNTLRDFPHVSVVKNLLAKWEIWIRYLDQEYALEKEMATHSSIFPGKSRGQAGRLQSIGSQKKLDMTLATK